MTRLAVLALALTLTGCGTITVRITADSAVLSAVDRIWPATGSAAP